MRFIAHIGRGQTVCAQVKINGDINLFEANEALYGTTNRYTEFGRTTGGQRTGTGTIRLLTISGTNIDIDIAVVSNRYVVPIPIDTRVIEDIVDTTIVGTRADGVIAQLALVDREGTRANLHVIDTDAEVHHFVIHKVRI